MNRLPGAPHGRERFEQLAGSWEGPETMYPSTWVPEGGVAVGRMKNRVALSGLVLITDYEQARGDTITHAGHGVFSFDPEADLYALHWFDSLGSRPEVFAGRFDDGILTVSHAGPHLHARLTYDLTEAPYLSSRMAISHDGVAWNTMYDGRYRRS